jgi:hypothetical protein
LQAVGHFDDFFDLPGDIFHGVFSVVFDCPFLSASRAGLSRAARFFAPCISPLTDRARCYA